MKKCVVCGRECDRLKRGMCQKHYVQFRKYGKVLDNNPRTIYDPNEIIEYDDYAEIVLYNNNCKEVGRALIDLDDVDIVKQYKWRIKDNGYVLTDIKGSNKKILLHRFIMDCPKDMVVDHINHNRLDNRKENLRICTQQQNTLNRNKTSKNTSGIVGVWWYKQTNKWAAQIQVNSARIHLGYFNTKEEAADARKQAELEYFGEYRNDNKDDE